MKRNILLLTLMLILALLLAACGGGATDEEPETVEEETTTETAEEEAPAEETVEEETAEEETTTETAEESSDGACEGSIAVLLPDSASSARWEADDRRYFEEAFSAAGVEYTIVNAEGDARTQQTQAEQAITNGAKVILLVNLDSGSGAAIIAQARDAGVKVIDYDRLTIEGPGADVYVSFDNVSVGRLMGETLEPIIDGLDADPKRVVLLNGSPTDNNATLFREGYFGIANPHFEAGDWELVADQAVPDWDNQQALVIFEQILTAAGGDVDAVFAANDGLANSVISALKSQGLDPLPVSGQDATAAGIQNILSGWQTMTVYKPIKLEADAAAEAAIALLCGEDVTSLTSDTLNNGTNDVPFIKLTPLAVTSENIEETVIADGFRTWEEICVGEFAMYCPVAEGGEEPVEEAEGEMMEGCTVDLTGETITLHQQAGREGPIAAILGEAFAYATEDALAAINSAGGVCGAQLAVEFNETNYDVEQEVAVYEQTRDDAILIFTYGSGATVALSERLNEDQILSFAAGVNGPAIYVPRGGYTVGDVPIYSDQFAGFLQWLSDNWADVKPESAGDDIVVGVVGWANAYGAGATTPEALAFADSLGITVLPLEEQQVAPDYDVSGNLQNLLANGANVIYNQNLSFSTAQVIGTLQQMGVWNDVVVGGVGWSFNQDVLNFLGENAALAGGYYGVVPHLTWSDDAPIIEEAAAAFEAGGYPATEKTNTYLLTYATFFAVKDIIEHAVNEYGYENLSGETLLQAANDIGIVDAAGLFQFNLEGENRAPDMAHIRQWQVQEDGTVIDVPITEFFTLPDTRPPAE